METFKFPSEAISAEDVLQQTFVRAALSIGGFQERGPNSFASWLMTIAGNLVRDAQKRRRRERLEVLRPELVGTSRRVEGVSQAHEPACTDLVGDHAGDPSAHGFPADHDLPATAEPFHDLFPRVPENRLPIRSTSAPPGLAPRAHVGELEARDPHASAGRKTPGDGVHERRIHRGAGPVREDDGDGSVLGAVEEEVGIRSATRHGRILAAERPLQ